MLRHYHLITYLQRNIEINFIRNYMLRLIINTTEKLDKNVRWENISHELRNKASHAPLNKHLFCTVNVRVHKYRTKPRKLGTLYFVRIFHLRKEEAENTACSDARANSTAAYVRKLIVGTNSFGHYYNVRLSTIYFLMRFESGTPV